MNTGLDGVILSVDYDCDLSPDLLKSDHITRFMYCIVTDKGEFQIGRELSDRNLKECLAAQGKNFAFSVPDVSEYAEFFYQNVQAGLSVLHISSAHTEVSGFSNAVAARRMLSEQGVDTDEIYILEVDLISVAYGMYVEQCYRGLKEGLSLRQIVEEHQHRASMIMSAYLLIGPVFPSQSLSVLPQSMQKVMSGFKKYQEAYMNQSHLVLGRYVIAPRQRAVRQFLGNSMNKGVKDTNHWVALVHNEVGQELVLETVAMLQKNFGFRDVKSVPGGVMNRRLIGEQYIGVAYQMMD